MQVDNSKYKSAFGADGAQIVPTKRSQFQAGRLGENRAPLHLPKQQPKFKKNTMIQLLEKEDYKPGGRRGPVGRAKDARNSPSRHLLDEKKRSKEPGSAELAEADRNNNLRSLTKKGNEPSNGAGGKNGNSGFPGGKREASPVDPT